VPGTDQYGQSVAYPLLSDAPDIETTMRTLVNGVVPHTVLHFADANERAASLTGAAAPIPGMVTYLVAEDRWEGRRADGSWLLLSDGPWTPLSFTTGYTAYGGSPGWRRKAGGGIELRGRVKRTDHGNLINDGTIVVFATMLSSVAPASIRHFITATNRRTSGGVTYYTCRVEVSPTLEMRYTVEAGGGVGTVEEPPWFSLDGIQFSPAGD